MTDEELGRAIIFGRSQIDGYTRNQKFDYADIGAAYRTLLAARPEVTREEVKDWYHDHYNAVATNGMITAIIDALSHFAPPPAPLPPICGMSRAECRMLAHDLFLQHNGTMSSAVGIIGEEFHRLAQLAQVDPDAEAKRLCWEYLKTVNYGMHGDKEAAWADCSEHNRNGWRAVAAAKEHGE